MKLIQAAIAKKSDMIKKFAQKFVYAAKKARERFADKTSGGGKIKKAAKKTERAVKKAARVLKNNTLRIIGSISKKIKAGADKAKKFWREYQKKIAKKDLIKFAAVLVFCTFIAAEYSHQKNTQKYEEQIRPLKEKIGQMIMTGFRGTEIADDSYIAKAIQDLNLGGVILFDYDAPSKSRPRNITGFEQTKKLIADLKSRAGDEPLLVAVDAEGGLINRLKPSMGFAQIDSAQDLGEKDGLIAANEYWTLAQELSELGFNINFGPVVDLNVNPKNPVIGGLERSYSDDPETVAGYAKTFVAAHRAFGILTSLKHFPGHGSSDSDSHMGLPDITRSYEDQELKPYEELIKSIAADSVMTAHIMNKNIDPDYPATLSPKFIQEILRQNLGFDGVVFSDDMQMGAIAENYGFEDAIIRAVNAGCDILIFSNNGAEYDESVPARARDIILQAVLDGRIPEARITQSHARITQLKSKIKD